MTAPSRPFLLQLMQAALVAADPAVQIPRNLPGKPKGRTIVVGAGKASANMAQAFEKCWNAPVEGLVVTRYDHAAPCKNIEIVEAAHPVPDAAGQKAATRILEIVQNAGPDDLVVCMISGGGSALLALPAPGISLEDKQTINKALLRSGATIAEMNCVRKHLSSIKGGRLAAACAPAKMITYLVSDVPGDAPTIIASGPTVGDPTSQAQARAILARYKIPCSEAVNNILNDRAYETVKPDDTCFDGHQVVMLARPQDSLEAAAKIARDHGITPVILGDAIEGESRDVAIMHAGIARQVARHGQPAAKPCVLLSGGETTVTVTGKGGRGGRNSEFLLSLMIQLRDDPGFAALAIDTDGIDGSEDNAGAIIEPGSWRRSIKTGLDPHDFLTRHDSYSLFEKTGDLVVTGPTLTNVNDFRAILIE